MIWILTKPFRLMYDTWIRHNVFKRFPSDTLWAHPLDVHPKLPLLPYMTYQTISGNYNISLVSVQHIYCGLHNQVCCVSVRVCVPREGVSTVYSPLQSQQSTVYWYSPWLAGSCEWASVGGINISCDAAHQSTPPSRRHSFCFPLNGEKLIIFYSSRFVQGKK